MLYEQLTAGKVLPIEKTQIRSHFMITEILLKDEPLCCENKFYMFQTKTVRFLGRQKISA